MQKKISMTGISLGFIFLFFVFHSSLQCVPSTEITVKEITPFSYCCLHHKGPYSDMEPIITQLIAIMQNQNLAPTGTLLSVYYSDPGQVKTQDLEWEVGFPISEQVSVEPPLIKKQWTHQLVVQAVHAGPYEKTSETITEILEWMSSHGYVQDGPILGFYLNMPDSETRPEDLKTEIWVSCKKD